MDNNIDANYEYLQEQQMMLEEPQEQAAEGDDVESLSQTQGEEAIDDDDQGMMGDSVFANVGQGLEGNYRNMMMAYWQETINSIEHEDHDFRNHPAAACKNQESYEDRRRGTDDQCGGSHSVCQRMRYLHHRADDACLDTRRGEQKTHAATE